VLHSLKVIASLYESKYGIIHAQLFSSYQNRLFHLLPQLLLTVKLIVASVAMIMQHDEIEAIEAPWGYYHSEFAQG
jgi:hypothetical protein